MRLSAIITKGPMSNRDAIDGRLAAVVPFSLPTLIKMNFLSHKLGTVRVKILRLRETQIKGFHSRGLLLMTSRVVCVEFSGTSSRVSYFLRDKSVPI